MDSKPDEDLNKPPRTKARWGQQRRLEFIEYRLRWDSHVNRSDLTSFFGISVPQASLDLSEYDKLAPGNLDYDASTRAYRASSSFAPIFPSSGVERYLDDLLRMTVEQDVPYGSFLGTYPPVASVPRPWRRLDTEVIIAVTTAIRNDDALDVLYQSFSSPNPAIRRITPHALAYDGYRWHMRAYCHKNEDFRDFLLSRVLHIDGKHPDRDRQADDRAWSLMVDLVLVPHPGLSTAHRKVIELDFGMTGGECHLECRQAMLFYVLHQLGLGEENIGHSPESQQITLKNRAQIAKLLPKVKYR